MTHDKMIEVIEHHKNGGEVEFKRTNTPEAEWITSDYPIWDFSKADYRIKEKPLFTYPMWFKSKRGDYIVKFESMNKGTVVKTDEIHASILGLCYENLSAHVDRCSWEQTSEPNTKIIYEYILPHPHDYEDYYFFAGTEESLKMRENWKQAIKTGRQWKV